MKIGSLLVLLFGVAPMAVVAHAATPKDRPNIIFILTDDLGYGDVDGVYPPGKIKTPQLDHFVTQSMVFEEAHSSSAVCTPSRYSILTGRYNWRSKEKSGVLGGFSHPMIETGRQTVADLLRSQGYKTACIGKWHLGMEWPRLGNVAVEPNTPNTNSDYGDVKETDPLDKNANAKIDFAKLGSHDKPIGRSPITNGFDEFFGISASLDMAPYVYIQNDHLTEVPTLSNGFLVSADGKKTRIGPAAPDFKAVEVLPTLTQHAIDYVTRCSADAHGGKPFFLYLALPTPHEPIAPSTEWQGKSGLNFYADYVMETDAYIGKLLAALDKNGLTANTLVIFTSDNGCSPAADIRFLTAHGHYPSAGRRGYKSDIWDGGHRIPLVVRWPGHIAPNTRTTDFACLGDFMATCADLLGVKLPETEAEDSISFLPVLLGKSTGPGPRDTLAESSIDGSFGIRQGPWKLIFCPGSGGWSNPANPANGKKSSSGTPRFQLYNCETDPAETTNVLDQHPDVVNRLGHLMRDYIINGRSTPGAPQQNDPVKSWPQIKWMDEFK
jgi:arylsulfatase A